VTGYCISDIQVNQHIKRYLISKPYNTRSASLADEGVDRIAFHLHMKFKARPVSVSVHNYFMKARCRLYGFLFLAYIYIAYRPTSPNTYVVKWMLDFVRANTAVKRDTKLLNCI